MELDDIMKRDIWSMKDIAAYLGLSVTRAYAVVNSNPSFPKPIRLAKASRKWSASKVKAWLLNS